MLKGAEVLFESESFEPAEAHYRELCRAYWDEHLASTDSAAGMASAWGLLGLDIEHAGAARRILRDGSAADQKRFQQLKNRARHAKGGVGWKRRAP